MSSILEAEPLSIENGFASDCFIGEKRNSLIYKQEGFPFGLSGVIDSNKVTEISAGFIFSDKKNGFNYQYQKTNKILKNFGGLSAGFDAFSIGSGFSFVNNFLNTSSDISFFLLKNKIFTVSAENYLPISENSGYYYHALNLTLSDEFHLFGMNYLYYSIFAKKKYYKDPVDSLLSGLSVKGTHFFDEKKPFLYIFLNPNVEYVTKSKNYTSNVIAGIGTTILSEKNFSNTILSVCIDKNRKYSLISSIIFKPMLDEKQKLINCQIDISSDTLKTGQENLFDTVAISLKGTFSSKKNNVKNWTIVIEKSADESVIKTFSGSGIPPSVLYFNGSLADGTLIKKGNYKLFGLIIDCDGYSVKSHELKLTVIE